MLLPEALNETQLITLRDVLRTAGLKERQIEDVMLLLWTKPHRIQLAFYYRSCGMTYEAIAAKLSVTHPQIMWDIEMGCKDINLYLKNCK